MYSVLISPKYARGSPLNGRRVQMSSEVDPQTKGLIAAMFSVCVGFV